MNEIGHEGSAVWKFPLPVADETGRMTMEVPAGWKPLHLALQHERATLWALVHPDAKPRTVRLRWLMTGEVLEKTEDEGMYVYLGTALHDGGAYVVHLFLVYPAMEQKSWREMG